MLNPKTLIKDVKPTDEKLGQTKEEYIEIALKEADILWNKIKKIVKESPEFIKLSDKEKIELFIKEHREFQNEFPIVARYMICMGQYKQKAFKRYLNKVRTYKVKAPEKREKGYMEDQWVDRQADYVKYLWEEYQKASMHRFTQHDARKVWKSARESIKREFDDFRNSHKKAEEKIAEEKKINKKQLTKELIDRIKLGKQQLSKEDLEKLLWETRARVHKQRKEKVMEDLKSTIKKIKPSRESYGTQKELNKGNKGELFKS